MRRGMWPARSMLPPANGREKRLRMKTESLAVVI